MECAELGVLAYGRGHHQSALACTFAEVCSFSTPILIPYEQQVSKHQFPHPSRVCWTEVPQTQQPRRLPENADWSRPQHVWASSGGLPQPPPACFSR